MVSIIGKNILFFFLSILLIFFLSFLFVCLFLFPIASKNGEVKVVFEKYQYFQKDYLRNETSFGIVSFHEEIDQFISYDDYELQKSILISSFGTEEFECFGSCYCENDEKRRISHSQVLIEGISYLLAAVSSVIAFNVAKEYFSEKCLEKYSNICESKSIKSEVNNCEKVVSDSDSIDQDRERGEKRVYFCYGNCLDRINPNPKEHRPTAKEQGFDCKKLKQEGEIFVYGNELIAKSPYLSLSSKMLITSRHKFLEYNLVPFCKENSKIEYEYQSPNYYILKSGEKKYRTLKGIGYMCVGIRCKIGKSQLQNVRCRLIDPKPTNSNNAYWDKIWWEEKEEWDKMF